MTDNKDKKTTAKLRDDIDRGKAADKIGFPDPAAAPLGTDAETGGSPPTQEETATAYHDEIEKRPKGPSAATKPRPITTSPPSPPPRRNWVVIAVVTGIAILGLAAMFWVMTG